MPFGKGEQIRRRWAQVIGAARLKRTRTEAGIRCSYVTLREGERWHFSYLLEFVVETDREREKKERERESFLAARSDETK